jgi:hypothetical protein
MKEGERREAATILRGAPSKRVCRAIMEFRSMSAPTTLSWVIKPCTKPCCPGRREGNNEATVMMLLTTWPKVSEKVVVITVTIVVGSRSNCWEGGRGGRGGGAVTCRVWGGEGGLEGQQ